MYKPIQSIGKITLLLYNFTTLKHFHTLVYESSYPVYPYPIHIHMSYIYVLYSIGAAPTSKLRYELQAR